MSSTISLVVGAIGLIAAVFALFIVVRRAPGRSVAEVPETAQVSPQLTAEAQRVFEDASREADQVRSRAEADAAAIMRRQAWPPKRRRRPAGTLTMNCGRSARKPRNCGLTSSAGKPGWRSASPG